jgi:hypothetical protein
MDEVAPEIEKNLQQSSALGMTIFKVWASAFDLTDA